MVLPACRKELVVKVFFLFPRIVRKNTSFLLRNSLCRQSDYLVSVITIFLRQSLPIPWKIFTTLHDARWRPSKKPEKGRGSKVKKARASTSISTWDRSGRKVFHKLTPEWPDTSTGKYELLRPRSIFIRNPGSWRTPPFRNLTAPFAVLVRLCLLPSVVAFLCREWANVRRERQEGRIIESVIWPSGQMVSPRLPGLNECLVHFFPDHKSWRLSE